MERGDREIDVDLEELMLSACEDNVEIISIHDSEEEMDTVQDAEEDQEHPADNVECDVEIISIHDSEEELEIDQNGKQHPPHRTDIGSIPDSTLRKTDLQHPLPGTSRVGSSNPASSALAPPPPLPLQARLKGISERASTSGGGLSIQSGVTTGTTLRQSQVADTDGNPGSSQQSTVYIQGRGYSCHSCGQYFVTRSDLMSHIRREHGEHWRIPSYQWGGETPPPWVNSQGEIDTQIKSIYERFGVREIERDHRFGSVSSQYNFHLPNGQVTRSDISSQLEEIYLDQKMAFKINLSLGIVLKNIETGEYRYWWAHHNDPVLRVPARVSRREDLEELKSRLSGVDFDEQAWHQRPSTKFQLVRVTNIRWYVTKSEYVLGNPRNLPNYIKQCHSIISFVRHSTSGKPITDNLCAFRCLAYHNTHKRKGLENLTYKYFQEWVTFRGDTRVVERYRGLSMEEIPLFESFFRVSINIFSRDADGKVQIRLKSKNSFPEKMDLNLFENHLSFISNFPAYAKKFECRNCGKLSLRVDNIRKHEKTCESATNLIYPGGFLKQKRNVFEELEGLGFHFEDKAKFFPYFAVYDFEVYFNWRIQPSTSNTQWIAEHVPISVGLCSNVPGFENPKCFISRDSEELVKEMIDYLTEIRSCASKTVTARFSDVFQFLKSRVEELEQDTEAEHDKRGEEGDDHCNEEAMETSENEEPSPEFLEAISKENTFQKFLSSICDDADSSYSDTDKKASKCHHFTQYGNEVNNVEIPISEQIPDQINERDVQDSQVKSDEVIINTTTAGVELNKQILKQLKKIQTDLKKFCEEFPVLGFNSARYDINLVKTKLIKQLKLASQKDKEAFVVKRNNSYVCIALQSFKFLDVSQYLAPGVSYEAFLKAYDCSQCKGYFPYEWFDSVEKLNHTSLPDHSDFFSSLKQTNISEEAYAFCQKVWENQKMTTFKDFLKWYNILDVEPFVEAVEKMRNFFEEYGVDLFKETLSVPGVARKMVFKSIENRAFFALPSKKFADIHDTFKKNIVGGPSLVFHRYHEKHKTKIRGEGQICETILGLDANSLYLYAFSLPAPSGPMTVRREANNFKPEKSERFMKAFHWLEWEIASSNMFIQHKLNGGEKQVGPFRVDGFCPENNTVYSFHGCYFHCHGAGADCELTKNIKSDQWKKRGDKIYRRTVQRREFIESQGFIVKEMWECEFDSMVKKTPTLKNFIIQNFTRKTDCLGKLTMEKILELVTSGKMFGAVEVDISVPENLFAMFEEMCPLFCNTEVPYEAMGEHMQGYLSFSEGSTKARRLLVGVMKAKQILLATPLLKWYMKHGLEVTKVYKVIEFTPSNCFSKFVDMVTEGRRKGDKDPKYELIGQTLKLIGNSAYGSMLMDSTKHRKVVYTTDEHEAHILANDKAFRQLSELGEGLFEFEMAKKSITLDLPIQIGFFILQYAKLRMLEFYYDCLDRFIDRKNFQLVCMDTDSYYLALAEKDLESCIKPEMREIYMKEKAKWFPRTSSPEVKKFDQRTPGLFKIEFEGDMIVALCSKTYCVEKKGEEGKNKVKYSSKGLMKRMGENPITRYQNVLSSGENSGSVNTGFRVHENGMFTYSQYRDGLSYFYCKRIVQHDGVSTSPLDIEGIPM